MDVHRPGFVEQRKLLEQAENIRNANRDDRVLVEITTSDLEFLLHTWFLMFTDRLLVLH